ncbi:MAG TPA: Mur ligase domain-containing protein, partial [Ruania sp.]|nr:Mur ligase domain-containing protein [Ruania sp.]
MRAHFIAIGGAGMSVIAELMLAQGHQVSGSDRSDSPVLQRLAQLGARVHVGHDPDHVRGAQLVVVSTAIAADNPELQAAHALGIEVVHRSVALARVAGQHQFVAVAGAHGKTTTSAMLALALTAAGRDPGYAIGARLRGHGSGAHLGSGTAFVAEADESDGSFLAYTPQVAVVTNIEPDHLDHYGSAEAVREAFVQFAGRIRPGGLLVACSDDPGAAELLRQAAQRGVRTLAYGTAEEGGSPEVRLELARLGPESSDVILHGPGVPAGGPLPVHIAVPGEHNARNAVAAWCAGHELGVPAEEMAAALQAFTGTARRFEDRGS